MARWTEPQVAELAPDGGALAAARRLARPGPWSGVGSTEVLLWGRCQGSGRTPYQVSVDLTGPVFRCSCPSRKTPCKHALGLMLLWLSGPESGNGPGDPAASAPDWAAEPTGRGSAGRPIAGPDPMAQARRLERRIALMSAGMDEFAVWLTDLVRAGLAAARSQSYRWWDDTAARLVDAQLPGLAEQVRTMASEVHRREDWADHLLGRTGRWWTATRAWAIRDQLDAGQLGDLRVFLGWSQPSAEVRDADRVTDDWLVLGVHRTDEGRIQQQRTWLRGTYTRETVLLLDFAAGGTVLPVPQLAGAVLTATLARYPGTGPRRALLVEPPVDAGTRSELPGAGSITAALQQAAAQCARNPWSDRVPVVLGGACVVGGTSVVGAGTARDGESAPYVVDEDGARLPLVPDAALWLLLALTGGGPVPLFGELEDGRFRPLSVACDGTVTPL